MSVIRKLVTHWQFKVDKGEVKAFVHSVDNAKKGVDSVKVSVRQLGKQVAGVGKMFAAFGGAVTTALLVPALKLEDSLKTTMTMVSADGAEFKKIEKGLLGLGTRFSNQMNIAATDINEGFYAVLSTGAKALSKEFMSLSDTGLKLAKVSGLTPKNAIERLADSVNGLNLPMTKAKDVADKFFMTTKVAATDLQQLTMAMREAGPIIGTYGIQLEEALGILGMFAQGGVKGAEAGTAFRMVLARLSAPGGEAQTRDQPAPRGLRLRIRGGSRSIGFGQHSP